jgi:hypothetical protein
MSLFGSPKQPEVPKEAPEVTAARQRAQEKADSSATSAIQDQLRRQMQFRIQRFGLAATDGTPSAAPSITSGFITPSAGSAGVSPAVPPLLKIMAPIWGKVGQLFVPGK